MRSSNFTKNGSGLLKGITVMLFLLLFTVGSFAATYYSTGSVAANTLTNWKTARDGTGTSPANFTSGDIFVIQNGHSMTTSAAWTVSGTNSKIQIENQIMNFLETVVIKINNTL